MKLLEHSIINCSGVKYCTFFMLIFFFKGLLYAQETETSTQEQNLEEVVVLGSRTKSRSQITTPVPVDVIGIKDLVSTGQIDVGQSLTYAVPSFNAPKFGINDLAPLVDPAMLRGLGPDQTLLLVNGKRRHKVAFMSVNAGVGKGQVGNDMNAIPASAVKRIEILRDGAAAQYGSDAIAGVINMELNNAKKGWSLNLYTGLAMTDPTYDAIPAYDGKKGQSLYPGGRNDGETYKVDLNFGLPFLKDGFINTTLSFHDNEAYSREGDQYAGPWYSKSDKVTNDELLRKNNVNLKNRAVLGGVKNTTYGIFVNAGKGLNEAWKLYAFGGYTHKKIVAGIFSRPAATSKNSSILYPNGYNPSTQSYLSDFMIVAGVKGHLGNGYSLDISGTRSGNSVRFYATNTANPSMGERSPKNFYTGALATSQTVFNVDATKTFEATHTSVALGSEWRFEDFSIEAGQEESYLNGGAKLIQEIKLDGTVIFDNNKHAAVGTSGKEGYDPLAAGKWRRNNVGLYAEIQQEFGKKVLATAAARWEHYSDFGSNFSYKFAARYEIFKPLSIRASLNRSFRAPSIVQANYSNYTNLSFDNAGNPLLSPMLPIRLAATKEALGISQLSPEISMDYAVGIASTPLPGLIVTVDAYWIDIQNRILISPEMKASLFPEFATNAYDNVQAFMNAYDTRTQGLDIVANYTLPIGKQGKLIFNLGINLNKTSSLDVHFPDKINATIPDIKNEASVNQDIIYFTQGTPNQKYIISATYDSKWFSILLRGTQFGEVSDPLAYVPGTAKKEYQTLRGKHINDLVFTFKPSSKVNVSLGVNNLFDVYPDMLLEPQQMGEVIYSRRVNQFGTQGRFLYLKLSCTF